ncbi:Hypothetical_protein [Hexamita inflata]|uniref:Hypothetical_protein n=1 Tax=Hexamita inflata TaxID=28002 RepID=A0AA86VCV4_9EUKA|nr:Hypothetical protein HINF_LOCUS50718 [Hexamita inflata]CAI9969044.1 Hypothetical protein HINF_LOCUS56689 [Hexamita inflata]
MEAKQIKTELKELKRPKTPVQIRELYIKRDLNETVKQAKQTLKKNPGNVFSTKAPDMTHNDFARLRINSQMNRKRSFSAEYNFNYKEAHETTRKGTKMYQQTHVEAKQAIMKEIESIQKLNDMHNSAQRYMNQVKLNQKQMNVLD